MTFDLAIFRQGEDEVTSTGEIVWVNADQTTHKSVPVPERLAGLIRAQEGERLA
jgi:acyl-CoA thioester hydrolase